MQIFKTCRSPMEINTLLEFKKKDWWPRSFLYRVFQITDQSINRIGSQMDRDYAGLRQKLHSGSTAEAGVRT